MGLGRKKGPGGGGAALNFKVVLGLTQPVTASENTIWVNTEKIGSWYFSATQPEGLQEWDVWIQTGTESAVEFNAIKKNAVQVYPLSAKQYINDELVYKEAKSYQNGEWVSWITKLFDNGDQCSDLTGGWGSNGYQISGYAEVNATVGNTLKMTSSSSQICICGTQEAVDLTNATYVVFDVKTFPSGGYKSMGVKKTKSLDNADGATGSIAKTGQNRLLVSGLSGTYYISANAINCSFEISGVWLE